MATAVSKTLVWGVLIAALVGAGLGVAELHVVWTVFCLIAASVSALVLLSSRARAREAAAAALQATIVAAAAEVAEVVATTAAEPESA